jgi:hypothetical protein
MAAAGQARELPRARLQASQGALAQATALQALPPPALQGPLRAVVRVA